jgi:hypothetical protein
MTEIEYVKSMETLEIRDGDILVLKVDRVLTPQTLHNIRLYTTENLPEGMKDVKIFILEPGADLGAIRKADKPAELTAKHARTVKEGVKV